MANEEQKKYLKEAAKLHTALPEMSEMIGEASQGLLNAEQYSQQYGLEAAGHYAVKSDQVLLQQMKGDLNVRSSRKLDKKVQKKEDYEAEAKYRSREESYQKKKSEQEEDAFKRLNGQRILLPNALTVESDLQKYRKNLKSKGKNDITEEQRKYWGEFADICEELLKIMKKPGVKDEKHLALLVEKYHFYKEPDNMLRMMGRERAKNLMKGKKRKSTTKDGLPSDTSVQALLNEIVANKAKLTDRNGKDTPDGKTIRQAFEEYRRLMETRAETEWKIKNLEKEDPGSGLYEHVASLKRDIRILDFYAEAAEATVRFILMDDSEKEAHAGELAPYAGYMMKQYGVQLNSFEENTPLARQKVARRIGVQNGAHKVVVSGDQVSENVRKKMEKASTGYQIQEIYEGYHIGREAASELCTTSINAVATETADLKSVMTGRCFTDMGLLTQELPYHLQDGDYGLQFTIDSKDEKRKKQEKLMTSLKNLAVIKDRASTPKEVMKAIREGFSSSGKQTSLVQDSVDRITAYMATEDGKKLFSARNASTLFYDTAGLPTLHAQVRELRDVLSEVLQGWNSLAESDSPEAISTTQDVLKDLRGKWEYFSRVEAYISHREQMMQKAYQMTPKEFSEKADQFAIPDFDHWDYKADAEWPEISDEELEALKEKKMKEQRALMKKALDEDMPGELHRKGISVQKEEMEKESEDERNRQWQEKLKVFWTDYGKDLMREDWEEDMLGPVTKFEEGYRNRYQMENAFVREIFQRSRFSDYETDFRIKKNKLDEENARLDELAELQSELRDAITSSKEQLDKTLAEVEGASKKRQKELQTAAARITARITEFEDKIKKAIKEETALREQVRTTEIETEKAYQKKMKARGKLLGFAGGMASDLRLPKQEEK